MLKRKRLRIAAGLLFSLAFLEILCRIGLSLPMIKSRLAGNDYAFRQRWIRGQSGKEKMRHVQDKHHPRLGWLSIPDLRDLPVYKGKFLNTNSLGLRGTYEPETKKLEGKTRILFFGDSFTFGDEVSDDETFCHYLQEELPQIEILNFGVHGYGHDQMLLLLEDVGLKFKPDIVILGFVQTDSYRNTLCFRDFAKPKFDLKDGELVLTNVPVPTPQEVLDQELFRSAAWDMWGLLRHQIRMKTGENHRHAHELSKAILTQFVQSVREAGAEPIIFYLPMPGEVDRLAKKRPDGESFVKSFGEELDPPVITFSTLPGFEAALQDGRKLKRGGHWDPDGNQIIAEQIADFLRER